MTGLRIGAPDTAVPVERAEIQIAPYAGLLPGRSLTELRLHGLALTLEREDDGRWHVRGLPGGAQPEDDPLDALQGLGELQIVDARLTIDAPSLALQHALPGGDEECTLLLLGETREEFGGSVWQDISGQGLSGLPPQVDLANEAKLAAYFTGVEGITAAHDLSEGGLSQAVFEMLLGSGLGADLDLTVVHADPFTALFSESASRVLVAVTRDRVDAAVERAASAGIPVAVIGSTTEGPEISFAGQTVALDELEAAWAEAMPSQFS